MLTAAEVKAIHAAQVARYKGPDVLKATRTEVHAALQGLKPHPERTEGEGPDDHHARQKAHGKNLWEATDKLIAEAGIK
jgi:hypothetical protein